jgi:hypothetical protein
MHFHCVQEVLSLYSAKDAAILSISYIFFPSRYMPRCCHFHPYSSFTNILQVPVVARSKARTIFNRSNTGIVDFESRSRHGCVSAFFCVVLSCVGSGLETGWSPVQEVLRNVQKYIHNFQKSNSESEDARGPNPNLLLLFYKHSATSH